MKTIRLAATLIVIGLVLFVLIIAQNLIVPLVISIFLWYLINTMATGLHQIKLGGRQFPKVWALVLSSILIAVLTVLAVDLVVQTIEQMIESADSYNERFESLKRSTQRFLGLESLPSFAQIIEQLDLKSLAGNLGSQVSSMASNFILIVVYTLFLLLEQSSFPRKFRLLAGDQERFKQARQTLDRINNSMKAYISVKTGICFLTALLCYVLMWAVGLDFAVFWAFLIFIANFIPTFGSIFGTAFPSVFALIQFDEWTPFLILAPGIVAIDFLMGNLVEPKVMGDRLNISSVVVLISLSLWGTIWGITGMIFSVPITVAIILVCAEFPQTRKIAVLLSASGEVLSSEEEKEKTEGQEAD